MTQSKIIMEKCWHDRIFTNLLQIMIFYWFTFQPYVYRSWNSNCSSSLNTWPILSNFFLDPSLCVRGLATTPINLWLITSSQEMLWALTLLHYNNKPNNIFLGPVHSPNGREPELDLLLGSWTVWSKVQHNNWTELKVQFSVQQNSWRTRSNQTTETLTQRKT